MSRLAKKLAAVLLILGILTSCGSQLRVTDRLAGRDLPKLEKKLVKNTRDGKPDAAILLAEVLFAQGKHQRAFIAYTRAHELGQVTTDGQKRNFVHTAKAIGSTSPYNINTGYFNVLPERNTIVSPFCGNSPSEDIFPYQWNEYLFKTSSRQITGETYPFSRRPYLNIVAFGEGCRPIPLPDFLPPNLNTNFHDGPLTISSDGSLVVVNRTYRRRGKDRIRNLYLEYYHKDQAGLWKDPKTFPYSSTDYSVQHPVFSQELQTLYFSSDMPGGYGGFDLYMSKWNGKEWEPPINLGSEINSVYDEVSPSIDPDGNLVYATNHLETQGGLDLVLFKGGQRFLLPSPINTPFDDYGISYSDSYGGYFSSTRDRGSFRDNIYQFSIIDRYDFELYVLVYDNATKTPLEGVVTRFETSDLSESGQVLTNQEGEAYLFGKDTLTSHLSLTLNKQGFETKTLILDYDLLKKRPEAYYAKIGLDNVFIVAKDPHIESQIVRPTDDPTFRPTLSEGPIAEHKEIVTPRHPDTMVPRVEETLPRKPITESVPIYQTTVTETAQPFANIASGEIVLYFENNLPLPHLPISPYDATIREYLTNRVTYYRESASHVDEVVGFFREVEYGFESLNGLIQFIYDNIGDNTFDIFLRSYASPRTNSRYNKVLTERRGESIKNYVSNWRGGVLRSHIEIGNIQISTIPYGDTKAPPNVSASLEDRAASVYSVEAARERKVVLYWCFGNNSPRSVLAKAKPITQNYERATYEPRIETYKPSTQPYQNTGQTYHYAPRDLLPEAIIHPQIGKFYIVVGSTPSYQDAIVFLRQLRRRGYTNTDIRKSDRGWHQIYVQVYDNRQEADSAIGIYRSQIDPESWILFQKE